MATQQFPTFSSVYTGDTASSAQTVVLRDTDASINVGEVNATAIDLSGQLEIPTASKTTTYTAAGDVLIDCDATSGAVTVNLPAAAGVPGRVYMIRKTDATANAVIIDPSGSETINGATTLSLAGQYDSVTIVCNGTDWRVISSYSI